MKRVTEANQPVVVVEVVVEPVEVENPLLVVVVPVEVRDVEVVVARVAPNYTKYHPDHRPLNTLRVEFYLGSKIRQYFVPSSFIF